MSQTYFESPEAFSAYKADQMREWAAFEERRTKDNATDIRVTQMKTAIDNTLADLLIGRAVDTRALAQYVVNAVMNTPQDPTRG